MVTGGNLNSSVGSFPLRLAISAPYPEGSILKLAGYANAEQQLTELIMPSRRVARAIGHMANLTGLKNAAGRLQRGVTSDIPLTEIYPQFELQRQLSQLMPPLLYSGVDTWRLKRKFDSVVAGRNLSAADAIVCMPGAALLTYQQHPNLRKVHHQVDGLPSHLNEVLDEHYGRGVAPLERVSREKCEILEQELLEADHVISPSRSLSAQLGRLGIDENKIIPAPYGVDLSAFAPRAERHLIPTHKARVLYVGQISYRKGIPFLFEAAKHSSTEVLLVGNVVDKSLTESMPDEVTYLGPKSHSEVARLMAEVDAFVFPTLEDAFGLVVLEAAGSGLPVITTREAGASELLDPRDVRLVDAGSSVQLLEALDNVDVLRPNERNERAERIRSSAGDTKLLPDWRNWASNVLRTLAANQREGEK
ncbi:glycosyltransferase family 4 protein [Pseudarthrobacter siccitolerans]|nr:glycosyltransferase family 4 protein [Pseudarthrobacter siccitolerans]